MFLANIVLVQVNSSDTEFAIQSALKLMGDKVIVIVNTAIIVGLLIMLYTPLAEVLKLAPLSLSQLLLAAAIALVSASWYEVVKLVRLVLHKKEIQ